MSAMGGISFAYSQAIPAIKSGLFPDAISTDLHIGSMNGAMKDMLTTMSKFLAMGMDLPKCDQCKYMEACTDQLTGKSLELLLSALRRILLFLP